MRSLGDGGFGITYLALHQLLENKLVAIKEYMPSERAYRKNSVVQVQSERHREDFEYGLEKFFDEANNLHKITRLRNPALENIVNVETVFRENGTAYMVMDYVDGKSLLDTIDELVKTETLLPEERIRDIFEQLARAINFVHGQGLLHRDITPTNIIVRHKDNRPVLIDFGSARNQATLDVAQETTGTRIMFTPGYAPLEQCNGMEQDQRTDIYGLAATIYHLALREKPSESLTRWGKIDHDEEDPLGPSVRAGAKDGYSRELLETLDRGLGLRAKDRPDSIAEWVAPLGFDIGEKWASPPPATTQTLGIEKSSKLLKGLQPGRRKIFAAAAGIAVSALLLYILIPDSMDQRLNLAETELVENPFDESSLDSANDQYAQVRTRSDPGTDHYVRATAGGEIVDELRSFNGNVNARNIAGARQDYEDLEGHTDIAGLDESVMEQVKSVLLFESSLSDISELLAETNLEPSWTAEGDRLQTSLSAAAVTLGTSLTVEVDDTRVDAAKSALDAMARATDNMQAKEFAEAGDNIEKSRAHASNIGYGPPDLANAREAIVQMRGLHVDEQLIHAAERLGTATDPKAFSAARDAYENILRIDPSSVQATAGVKLSDRLGTISDRIAKGDVSTAEVDLQDMELLVDETGIKDQQWTQLQASFHKSAISGRLDMAAQALSANPLTAQTHQQASEHFSAVIDDTASHGLDSKYTERAKRGQTGVRTLQSILSAVNARDYAGAESQLQVSTGILQNVAGNQEIANSVARAISRARSSEVDGRMQTVLDALSQYRLPSVTTSMRGIVASARVISSDEPLVVAADSAIDELDELLRLQGAGNYADAHDQWRTVTETLEPLDIESEFTTSNKSWLDAQTLAAAKQRLAGAYMNLEISPLNAEVIDATRRIVNSTIELSQLADHADTNASILSDLLTTLESIQAALDDNDFITARQQATDAVNAIKKSELEVIDLQSALSKLIDGREEVSTFNVRREMRDMIFQSYNALLDDPLSVNDLKAVSSKLAGLDDYRDTFSRQQIEYDWSSADEAKSVISGLLLSIDKARIENDYVGATRSLLELDRQLTDDSQWGEILERARSAIQSEWNERIGTLVDVARTALEKDPLSAEALDEAFEVYQQIQELERSAENLGGNGQEFIKVLRPYSTAIIESDSDFQRRNAQKLLADTEQFMSLPGAKTAVTNLNRQISDKITLIHEDARNKVYAVLDVLEEQPNNTELVELTNNLDSLHREFSADGLEDPADFASETRAMVQYLVDARDFHDTRHYYTATDKLAEFKSASALTSIHPEAKKKLDTVAASLEEMIQGHIDQDYVQFTLDLHRAFKPLGSTTPLDRDVWSQIDLAVREVLDQQPDFPGVVVASEILQAFSASIENQDFNLADCASVGAALSARNKATNVPFDVAPLDRLYASSCAN